MTLSRFLLVCAATLGAVLLAPPARAAPEQAGPCPVARVPPLVLPHVKDAVARNLEVIIVALGSSSTQGWHSSDIAHSYPAILQSELAAALTESHIAVINRGIGGQDAVEMVPRIRNDVLLVRPTVVVWQVGANGAIKKLDPEMFQSLVEQGVRTMQDAGVDVVLMDNQQAPAILAAPQHARIAQALADVAIRTGAGLFGRGALMDQWRHAGHPYTEFIADDGVHHNDLGYRCVAKALAASMLEGMGVQPAAQPRPPSPSLTARR